MQNQNSVVVVTISEQLPCHGSKTDVVVFSTMNKAEAWINGQIALLVKKLNLDSEAVDGWFIELEGCDHTIQYDANLRDVL